MGAMKELAASAAQAGYVLLPVDLARALRDDLRRVHKVTMQPIDARLDAAVTETPMGAWSSSKFGLWNIGAGIVTTLSPLTAILLPPAPSADLRIVVRDDAGSPWHLQSQTYDAQHWPAGREALVALAEQLDIWDETLTADEDGTCVICGRVTDNKATTCSRHR